MSDEIKKKRNDKLFDAILKVAVEDVALNELAELPSDEELNAMYPHTAADDKILRLLEQEKKRKQKKYKRKLVMKFVASFATVFIIGTAMALAVEASRIFLFNTWISIREDHVAFEFAGSGEVQRNHILGDFEYIDSHHDNLGSMTRYVDAHGNYLLIIKDAAYGLGMIVDNEQREFQKVIIEEVEVFIFDAMENDIQSLIMWSHEGVVYQVIAHLDTSILLDIAYELIIE